MESEKIEIANRVVIFTDIHHFMTVAGDLKDKQHKFLQEFYDILGEIVVKHGGELIKYVGDGFICIFPSELAQSAVLCALKMRETFLQMVRRWKLPQEIELEVGVSGGKVTVGIFGHSSLRVKDVFGDVVNQAAIICHHRSVAITKWIHEKVKNTYQANQLPDVNFRWLDKPMKIWEIKGQK
jgi:adenylate cyclase